MIETVATNQLEAAGKRLVAQQTEARFGVADSYDRAARLRSDAGDNDPSPRHSDSDRAGFHGWLRRASHQADGHGGDAGGAAERASGRAKR